jgi:hypothetical protein
MDKNVRRTALEALTKIPRRAERQSQETLGETFVDIGPLFSTLNRSEHQVIYGRRGTGKTHALGALQTTLARASICSVYLDMRTVGSAGGLYSDTTQPLASRATQLLIDVIEALHTELSEFVYAQMSESKDVTLLVNALDRLATAATEVEVVGSAEEEVEEGEEDSRQRKKGAAISLSPKPELRLSFDGETGKKSTRTTRRRLSGEARCAVKFGPLAGALKKVVSILPGRELWLLLDEWSALPLELQPVLADLLRRAIFPVRGVTVKIAAIERRSKFAVWREDRDYLGIELGADASQDINLDDYLRLSANDERAQHFFGDLFLRHVAAVSPEVAAEFPANPDGRRHFIWAMWDHDQSFTEMIRAAEGIPRDGINITGTAAQTAAVPDYMLRGGISVDDVRGAARGWFLRDKEGSIKGDRQATRALANIVGFVANRRKRTFLIEREHDSRHKIIQDLYDARLIHLLRSAVGPNGAYDLFALDYGGYVNAIENDERFEDWSDLWATHWNEVNPGRSSLMRSAIIPVEELLYRASPSRWREGATLPPNLEKPH